jgi:hypothetical protein
MSQSKLPPMTSNKFRVSSLQDKATIVKHNDHLLVSPSTRINMVKRQKEKQYQSAREHRANSQLRAGSASSAANSRVQRRLPFDCCALTLTPYQTPVCTPQGIIFENSALLPFLLKHKADPVTGQKMTTRDIISLQMDKDQEGRWQCPVLTKPFSNQTKIVAIRQPGTNEANVYSFEAYQVSTMLVIRYISNVIQRASLTRHSPTR